MDNFKEIQYQLAGQSSELVVMNASVSSGPPSELAFFCTLAQNASLAATGRELGVSTAAVSKRLGLLERRLGVALVSRSTRHMSLTVEGERYLVHARRLLAEIAAFEQSLRDRRDEPQGLLRVNATLGFGRAHVAPVISRFARRHPAVQVQLQLTAHPPPVTSDSFDVCIRFGAPPDAHVLARRLAANRRLLCASPGYVARHGEPGTPRDLLSHQCICIRQGDEAPDVWRLSGPGNAGRTEAIKVRGRLSTNDGEIAVRWALDDHGVLMRAQWDVERYLRSGRLVEVLSRYRTPDADIYAVYPRQQRGLARVRAFVEFVASSLR